MSDSFLEEGVHFFFKERVNELYIIGFHSFEDSEKIFIFGMKANRLIVLSERGRKKGQYQSLSSLDLKDEETKKIWLKDLSFPKDTQKSFQKRKWHYRRLISCH